MKQILFAYFLSGLTPAGSPYEFTRFADFHIHTTFKHYYRDTLSSSVILAHKNDSAYLSAKYGRHNWIPYAVDSFAKSAGTVSHVMNYDQANFDNLKYTPGSVLCTSLYPYEKQFALSKFKRFMSNQFVSHIPKPRLKEIGSDSSNPFKEFLAEYYFLRSQDVSSPDHSFKIELAKNTADLARIMADPNATGQVLSIEGGQVLYGEIAGAAANVRKPFLDGNAKEEIMKNVQALRTLDHKVLFITPAHFTDNVITGFCKTLDRPGMKRKLLTTLSKSIGFRRSFFTKFGEGIHGDIDAGKFTRSACGVMMPYTDEQCSSDLGMQVIKTLLKPDSGKSHRILIDVKHMDIQARFEYYALLKTLNTQYGGIPIPIIAGHVAASGEFLPVAMATGLNPLFDRYKELNNPLAFYKKQLKKRFNSAWLCRTESYTPADRSKFFLDASPVPGSFNPFALQNGIDKSTAGWFYPWSINLCDEEIKLIYVSDGIIGLNFDERILGGSMLRYSRAYETKIESRYDSLMKKYTSPDAGLLKALSFADYYKSEPFIRNILYFVSRSGRNDKTAWNNIAIGSDFDGLIDPIDLCSSAEMIPTFHKQMVVYTDIFWQLHKKDAMFQNKDLFFNGSVSCRDAMRKVFYENGRDFIVKNF